MKTILEHLSRFDTEGYTEPPPPELPPIPPRSRVLYDNMRSGQYGYPTENSRRRVVRRCADRLLHASAYRGRHFWADIEDSVPELSAAPVSVSDSVPPYSTPPVSWYDLAPSLWPDELGPPMNLNSAYASLLASVNTTAESRREALRAHVETGPANSIFGNPTQWTWVNQAPTPEPNAQS